MNGLSKSPALRSCPVARSSARCGARWNPRLIVSDRIRDGLRRQKAPSALGRGLVGLYPSRVFRREGGGSRGLHSRDHAAWLPNAEYYREENRGKEQANKSSLGGGDGHERVNVYMTITGEECNTLTITVVLHHRASGTSGMRHRARAKTRCHVRNDFVVFGANVHRMRVWHGPGPCHTSTPQRRET